MTIPPTQRATELLISARAAGDARIQHSFRNALDHACRADSRTRCEELDALAGILDGLKMGDAGATKTLEPTLRHLLARVL